MPDVLPDFKAAIEALENAGVRYVIIGGLAMVAHGSAHVTQDLDIAYSSHRENQSALARALSPLKPRLRDIPEDVPFVFDERTLRNVSNLTLVTSAGELDLLSSIPGVDEFDKLWERAGVVELYGFSVRIAHIDDLIRMKQATKRPKDLAHLNELLELKRIIEAEDIGG